MQPNLYNLSVQVLDFSALERAARSGANRRLFVGIAFDHSVAHDLSASGIPREHVEQRKHQSQDPGDDENQSHGLNRDAGDARGHCITQNRAHCYQEY